MNLPASYHRLGVSRRIDPLADELFIIINRGVTLCSEVCTGAMASDWFQCMALPGESADVLKRAWCKV